MMTPYDAITADTPNVWMTTFYGFDPAKWGFLGFANSGQRNTFVRETQPGALVVIYGHKSKASKDQQGQVIGVQQVSHRVNFAKAFMDPAEWAAKEADPESQGKWDIAVKATRAWKVAPESYQLIDDFADESYSLKLAQHIGSQGVRLTRNEADKLLDITLVETSVFGEIAIDGASPVFGRDLLQPSKPGPVSQQGYYTREAEGPKQNYVLRLDGDTDAFLGYPANGRSIVKVGMSVSPATRRDAFNAALPAGTYAWSLLRSNEMDNRPPFDNSKLGLVGEARMKDVLAQGGSSLGGEFFVASDKAIARAWAAGQKAVQEYSRVI
ncbi:hypothetical protein [Planktotalea sp.]|uniref:hypothetical protein n=1 Tax=Planktotalea sp. TaxID=2029877 RepID=UPI003296946B